ncbi:hypothetical protein K3U93_18455 [Mycobacterium malmoense]|uniref:Facilitated glucose transporter n=1 Tax=Mycobacterium malmoense TaxID=1780 RepID=A0ABX3ST53_MYCMA|nr:hypothetical protein [Mycobacterium malmoense]OIN81063.1 hypothetical protein BMG05_09290 [Mycobacterium malmoense]ORA82074.1 hypothetical protein BST29_12845 [Mycobacterium malmoense]QZA16617.1 hypothetical protein K3U93_18455 [Mycobacterium malmoense]UNB93418.1 hypothetical protein H5T25_18440 [Mycobacterium malmoense]
MGYRFDTVANRQRSDLTETKQRAAHVEDGGVADPAIRFVVLALLAVDGVLSALAGALLLPFYIGTVPFPISGLLSGLLNAALVWAAGRWTRSPRVAALPLWTWLLTVAAMSMGGPADDVILGGAGLMAYGAPLLIALGVTPPAWVLWRRSRYR